MTDTTSKGTSYSVLVLWEDGFETFEPLSVIAKEDPITCAKYSKDKDLLLDKPGWKSLKQIASCTIKFAGMHQQAKLHTKGRGPIYKFGILLLNNCKQALQIDKNSNN